MATRSCRFLAHAVAGVMLWAAPAPSWSEASIVAPGQVVRIQGPDRIVVPGLVTLERGRLETRRPYEEKDGVLVFQDGDRTLHVPRQGKTLTGRLVGITDEVVVIRNGKDSTISVPRQAVGRLQVKRGGSAGAGALVGAAAGFGIGFAHGYNAAEDCWCPPAAVGILEGVLLALPGAALAELATGGRWRRSPSMPSTSRSSRESRSRSSRGEEAGRQP